MMDKLKIADKRCVQGNVVYSQASCRPTYLPMYITVIDEALSLNSLLCIFVTMLIFSLKRQPAVIVLGQFQHISFFIMLHYF